MIPKEIELKLQELNFPIENSSHQGGGDINSAAIFKSSGNNYFIKWNNAEAYPEMFSKEARGLKLLSKSEAIKIPEVILDDKSENYAFLILEYLENRPKSKGFFSNFGKSLARMHKNTSNYFGLDYDNYIGSLKQINSKKNNWIEFFIVNRLEFQLKTAIDAGIIDSLSLTDFSKLFSKLERLIPEEKPALVHGDLWAGNYLATEFGAAIIDPAVYYGHREMDLAMSKLFGGFDADFYSAYHIEFPLENAWQERLDLCNLYPLLVHVNLFGAGYYGQIKNILRRFI